MALIATIVDMWYRTKRRWLPWFPRLGRHNQALSALLVLTALGTGDPLACLWHCRSIPPISTRAPSLDHGQHHAAQMPDDTAAYVEDVPRRSDDVPLAAGLLCHGGAAGSVGQTMDHDSSFELRHEHTALLVLTRPGLAKLSRPWFPPPRPRQDAPQGTLAPPLRPPILDTV